MFGNLWNRLRGRSRDAAHEREDELERMSPEERRFSEESPLDHQSEDFVGSELGGIDPARLLDDGRPHDGVPRD